MINLEQLTPKIYYTKSRDFQFIGRLFDLVLNSIKTNADLLSNLTVSENMPQKWVDLVATSQGFQSKHNYSSKQILTICSVFQLILKKKGTIEAVNLIGKAIFGAEGITETFFCYLDNNTLKVFLPDSLTNITLFNDLLSYILPAGITCEITRATTKQLSLTTNTKLEDSVNFYKEIKGTTTSALFRPGRDKLANQPRKAIINSVLRRDNGGN